MVDGIYSRDIRIKEFKKKRVPVYSPTFTTKDIDFGEPSVGKKIYKVYVNFKSSRNGYSCPSGIKALYALDGSSIFTEFSDDSINYNRSNIVFSTDFNGLSTSTYGFEGINTTIIGNVTADGLPDTMSISPSNTTSGLVRGAYLLGTHDNWSGTHKWGSPIRLQMKYDIDDNSNLDGFALHCYTHDDFKWIEGFGERGYTSNNTRSTLGEGLENTWVNIDVYTFFPDHNLNEPNMFAIFLLSGSDSTPDTVTTGDDFIYFKDIILTTLEGLTDTDANIRNNYKDWVQAELLFPSTDTAVRSAKSIRLKFAPYDNGVKIPEGFEINDISIIYRSKSVK